MCEYNKTGIMPISEENIKDVTASPDGVNIVKKYVSANMSKDDSINLFKYLPLIFKEYVLVL